jgi:methyl-accepting chemotaxis protein
MDDPRGTAPYPAIAAANKLERLQSRVAEAVQRMESGQQRATEALSQAAEARQGLEGIAGGASRIADMTNQIAAAAEEQSIVAEEINRSVTSVRDVTVQTAAGVDELTRATRSLEEVAQGLQAAVGGFRV